jgi:hypothetical protein
MWGRVRNIRGVRSRRVYDRVPVRYRSDVHDHDSLILRTTRFLDQSTQVIRIAGEQYDGTSQYQSGSGDHGIDSASMAGHTCHTEQLAGCPPKLRSHWHDHNPGQHAMHRSVTSAAAENLRQRDSADDHLGSPGTCGLQIRPCARVTGSEFGQPFAVQDQRSSCT